jgi:hypothetical protein
MRFANTSRILLPLALSAVLATSVLAQDDHPNIHPNAVRDQLKTGASGQSQAPSAPPSQAPPTAQPATPASAGTKAKEKSPTTAKAPTATKAATAGKAPTTAAAAAKTPPKKAEAKPAKPPVEKPVEAKASFVKRDPFDTLLNRARAGDAPPENLPPGKAGLIVSTLRIDGIVRGPAAMIAIVSNPQQRVYFLHEGDKLYDGSVEKITLDAVLFHEIGKDAFGKPLEREVTRRLYPSPGEQQ